MPLSKSGPSRRAFYVDLLGMTLFTAMGAGPIVAYYLGNLQEGDKSPEDIAAAIGTRNGLLELIHVPGEEDSTNDNASSARQPFGLAHLGFRVPVVGETLRKAEQSGFKIMKRLGEADERHVGLPSWEYVLHQTPEQRQNNRWGIDYERIFGLFGFIQEPDG